MPRLTYVLRNLAIVCLYLVTGGIALGLHELGPVMFLVWAPSAIGFAFILVYGPRWWPGVAAGTFLVVWMRQDAFVAAMVTVAEVLESLVAFYVLRGLRFRQHLTRVRDVLAFVVVATVCAVLGATLGALLLAETLPNGWLAVWSIWWWVNISGDLIVVPALLTWLTRSPIPLRRRSHEAVALVLAGLFLSMVTLANLLPSWIPAANAPYYLLPLMLWAGMRFGSRGAATASLLASLCAIAADMLGLGPFRDRAELQAFIAISSVTTLVLSALAQERVFALERHSAIQRGALDAIITIDSRGHVLELNPAAEQLFGVREADVRGRALVSFAIPPRLHDDFHRRLRDYVEAGTNGTFAIRYRAIGWRAADRSEFPVDISLTLIAIGGELVLTAFVRDATDEQAAETARREANALLERKVEERTAALRESLHQGDILLREIHHRVKNNLQVISSLLNLQAVSARSETARSVLLESRNRIMAMALVHQLLYRSKEISRIDVAEYLRGLVERLLSAYDVDQRRIAIDVDAATLPLDLDRAITCGLIVNELVTNAVVHAFPRGRRGRIRVGFALDGELVALTISDDGIGIPLTLDLDHTKSFGLRLVRVLAQQLEGEMSHVRGDGTTIRIVFPQQVADHARAASS